MSRHSVHDVPTSAASPPVELGDLFPVPSETPGLPAGPAAAVVLAAGLASFALGLLSVLTASSTAVSSVLTFSARAGDLSGMTTVAATVFFTAWAVLAIAWRHADPPLLPVAAVASILIGLGLLGTFPPFFNLIGG